MKKTIDIADKKGLGAKRNSPDSRDIPMATVAAALGINTTTHPKKNITDVSMLTVEDQKQNGSCVGQAEGKDAEFKDYLETGKVTQLSKRALYAMCKAEDGHAGEGTYPRVAAKIRVSTGVPKESLVKDDNSLPHSEYINVEITNEIKTDASGTRSKGYSFVYTLDELKTAIDTVKVFNGTLVVGDWNTLPVKPKYADGTNRGQHRIWIIGYEDAKNGKKQDTKIYFLNSWGKNWSRGKTSADKKLIKQGIGWFWWSEFQGYFYDGIAYMDMPNEIIDYAKSQAYIFTRVLKKGMTGTDVQELQKRLLKEKAQDGRPCFLYTGTPTTYFGTQTELAVQRYQAVKGIIDSGTPETTGYGQVGPKTLKSLNEGIDEPEVGLFPVVAHYKSQLVKIMKSVGHEIVVTDEYRSPEEQDELYAQGRTKPGPIVTNAKGGESYHNWRCAFDVAFVKNGKANWDESNPWTILGEIGEALGLEWGGRWTGFVDRPHFQFTAGYSLSDFQNGKIDPKKFGEGVSQNYQVIKTSMKNLIKTPITPAQIVFVLMALAVIAAVFTEKITGQEFLTLASMAFAFYFVTPSVNKDEPAGSGK